MKKTIVILMSLSLIILFTSCNDTPQVTDNQAYDLSPEIQELYEARL